MNNQTSKIKLLGMVFSFQSWTLLKLLLQLIITVLLLLCVSYQAQAATFIWDGSSSTSWTDAANWDANAVPAASDEVIITGTVLNDPVINSSVTVKSIYIHSDGGKLSILSNGILRVSGSIGDGIYVGGQLINNGTIYVDNTGGAGIFVYSPNGDSKAYLYGDTYIGTSGNIGGDGIYVGDQLFIDTDPVNLYDLTPTVTIARTTGNGINCAGCTASIRQSGSGITASSTKINIGTAGFINGAGILTAGDFNFVAGTVTIQDSGTDENGLTNLPGGDFSMGSGATLNIGSASSQITEDGIENQNQFSSAGLININNVAENGINNTTNGTFTTTGVIEIGATASVGDDGILNHGDFTCASGTIKIDNVNLSGISNLEGATFTNLAAIALGSQSPLGLHGIFMNSSIFVNNGSIVLENAAQYGLAISNGGSFTNNSNGSVWIGEVGLSGITVAGIIVQLGSEIYNEGGLIELQDCAEYGLYVHNNCTFENIGGRLVSTGSGNMNISIKTFEQTSFINHSCSEIFQYGNTIINGDNLVNNGYIVDYSSQASNIDTNNGIVQDLTGGTFTITNNNGTLTTAEGILWTGCANTNWHEPGNWINGTMPGNSDDVFISAATNAPVIQNGNTAHIKSLTVGANASITNQGTLSVQGATDDGILNDGEIVNYGMLSVQGTGKDGFVNKYEVQNYGELRVDDSGDSGISNEDGATFSNRSAGVIWIGNDSGNIGDFGIHNVSQSIFNNSGGIIHIDNTRSNGILNADADFKNFSTGQINIGIQSGNIGRNGVVNGGEMQNFGAFRVDGVIYDGIYNRDGSTFTNESTGVIWVGNDSGNIGDFGVRNSNLAIFNNLGGTIHIDNTSSYGVYNSNAYFVNSAGAQLNIGMMAGNIGLAGIGNSGLDGYVYNNSKIQIDQTSTNGIANYGTFKNLGSGEVHLLENNGVHGLLNNSGAIWYNEDCAVVFLDNILNNLGGTIENHAHFYFNTASAHLNSGTFTNNGILSYATTSTVPNVTNNGIIIESIDLDCGFVASDAFQVGNNSNFTISGSWFNDPDLTNKVGNYKKSTNTFTATNELLGTHTLYFTASNGSCSLDLSVEVTSATPPTYPAGQRTWTGIVSGDWNYPCNWLPANVPTAADDVYLPYSSPNDPVIEDGVNAVAQSLTSDSEISIESGATLTVDNAPSNGIYLKLGNLTNRGTVIIGSTSTGGTGLKMDHDVWFRNEGGTLLIQNASGSAIEQRSGAVFLNSIGGTLGIGQNGGTIGQNGIVLLEAAVFDNQSGTVSISNTGNHAISLADDDAWFKNVGGQIAIAYDGPVGGNAITLDGLDAIFENYPCMQVDIASDNVISVLQGTFTNNGNIIENATGASNITTNNGVVMNLNGGTFAIANDNGVVVTQDSDHLWTGCSGSAWANPDNWFFNTVPTAADVVVIPNVTTGPVISSGTSAVCNGIIVEAGATLSIENGGSLAIDNAVNGMNISGTVNNDGTIDIGQNGGSITAVGAVVTSTGSLIVQSNGTLNIDNVGQDAMDVSGFFANANSTNIGQNGGADNISLNGIKFNGEVSNSGTINIDRTGNRALWAYGNFTNTGVLNMGQNGGADNIKWMAVRQASGSFYNEEGGIINIDNARRHGLDLLGNFYNNQSTINIGQNGTLGSTNSHFGINLTNGVFENINGGMIYVNNARNNGIQTSGSGAFHNGVCSNVFTEDAIDLLQTSSFTNDGFLRVDFSGTNTLANLINNGLIEDVQGTVLGTTNNEIIVAPVTTSTCGGVSPAFNLGTSVDFNILGIFTDEVATISAGTYDQGSNTFNPSISSGQYTLYVQIEDAVNGCNRVVPWSVEFGDTTPPVPTCHTGTNVLLDANGFYAILESDVLSGGTDNCGVVNFVDAAPATIDCTSAGSTVNVTVTVNDGNGNEGTCVATVLVSDNTPPAVTCPDNISVAMDAGQCGATVNWTAPIAVDNCQGSFTATQTMGDLNGSLFAEGTWTVEYSATDEAGNAGVCSFTVTVQPDAEAPIVNSNLVFLDCNGQLNGDLYEVERVATDNCDANLEEMSVIALPEMSGYTVNFRKKNKKRLKFKLDSNEILVDAPNNGGAEAWWSQILADGGVLVIDGQEIEMLGNNGSSTIQYVFDNSGMMTKVKNDSLFLISTAVDDQGNTTLTTDAVWLQCGVSQSLSTPNTGTDSSNGQATVSEDNHTKDQIATNRADQTDSLAELHDDSWAMFPNPATDIVTLRFDEVATAIEVRIRDIAGRLVFENHLAEDTDTLEVNLINWKAGTYLVQIELEGGKQLTKRLVVIDHP